MRFFCFVQVRQRCQFCAPTTKMPRKGSRFLEKSATLPILTKKKYPEWGTRIQFADRPAISLQVLQWLFDWKINNNNMGTKRFVIGCRRELLDYLPGFLFVLFSFPASTRRFGLLRIILRLQIGFIFHIYFFLKKRTQRFPPLNIITRFWITEFFYFNFKRGRAKWFRMAFYRVFKGNYRVLIAIKTF